MVRLMQWCVPVKDLKQVHQKVHYITRQIANLMLHAVAPVHLKASESQ